MVSNLSSLDGKSMQVHLINHNKFHKSISNVAVYNWNIRLYWWLYAPLLCSVILPVYILYCMLALTSKMMLGIALGRRPLLLSHFRPGYVPLIYARFHTHPCMHCCTSGILRCAVPVAHMSMQQSSFHVDMKWSIGRPVCLDQGFMQDQIIASHTCFGGHVDVNC